jgi:hypothetical protein
MRPTHATGPAGYHWERNVSPRDIEAGNRTREDACEHLLLARLALPFTARATHLHGSQQTCAAHNTQTKASTSTVVLRAMAVHRLGCFLVLLTVALEMADAWTLDEQRAQLLQAYGSVRFWSDAQGWPAGRLPSDGDIATVGPTDVVLLDRSVTARLYAIVVRGVLWVADGIDLELHAERIVVVGGMFVAGSAQRPRVSRLRVRLGATGPRSSLYDSDAPDLSFLVPGLWSDWPVTASQTASGSSVPLRTYRGGVTGVDIQTERLTIPRGTLLSLGDVQLISHDVRNVSRLALALELPAKKGDTVLLVRGKAQWTTTQQRRVWVGSSSHGGEEVQVVQLRHFRLVHDSSTLKLSQELVDLTALKHPNGTVSVAGNPGVFESCPGSACASLFGRTAIVTTLAALSTRKPVLHSAIGSDEDVDGDSVEDWVTEVFLRDPLRGPHGIGNAPMQHTGPMVVPLERTIVIESSLAAEPTITHWDGSDGSGAVVAGSWQQHVKWYQLADSIADLPQPVIDQLSKEKRQVWSGSLRLDGVGVVRLGRGGGGGGSACGATTSWLSLSAAHQVAAAVACPGQLSIPADGSAAHPVGGVPPSEGDRRASSRGVVHPLLTPRLSEHLVPSDTPCSGSCPSVFAISIVGVMSADDDAQSTVAVSNALGRLDRLGTDDTTRDRWLSPAARAVAGTLLWPSGEMLSSLMGDQVVTRSCAPTLRSRRLEQIGLASLERGDFATSALAAQQIGSPKLCNNRNSFVRRVVVEASLAGGAAVLSSLGVDFSGNVLKGSDPMVLFFSPRGRMASNLWDSDVRSSNTPVVALLGGPSLVGGLFVRGHPQATGLWTLASQSCNTVQQVEATARGVAVAIVDQPVLAPDHPDFGPVGPSLMTNVLDTWIDTDVAQSSTQRLAPVPVAMATPQGIDPSLFGFDPAAQWPASRALLDAFNVHTAVDATFGIASSQQRPMCGKIPPVVASEASVACRVRTDLAVTAIDATVAHNISATVLQVESVRVGTMNDMMRPQSVLWSSPLVSMGESLVGKSGGVHEVLIATGVFLPTCNSAVPRPVLAHLLNSHQLCSNASALAPLRVTVLPHNTSVAWLPVRASTLPRALFTDPSSRYQLSFQPWNASGGELAADPSHELVLVAADSPSGSVQLSVGGAFGRWTKYQGRVPLQQVLAPVQLLVPAWEMHLAAPTFLNDAAEITAASSTRWALTDVLTHPAFLESDLRVAWQRGVEPRAWFQRPSLAVVSPSRVQNATLVQLNHPFITWHGAPWATAVSAHFSDGASAPSPMSTILERCSGWSGRPPLPACLYAAVTLPLRQARSVAAEFARPAIGMNLSASNAQALLSLAASWLLPTETIDLAVMSALGCVNCTDPSANNASHGAVVWKERDVLVSVVDSSPLDLAAIPAVHVLFTSNRSLSDAISVPVESFLTRDYFVPPGWARLHDIRWSGPSTRPLHWNTSCSLECIVQNLSASAVGTWTVDYIVAPPSTSPRTAADVLRHTVANPWAASPVTYHMSGASDRELSYAIVSVDLLRFAGRLAQDAQAGLVVGSTTATCASPCIANRSSVPLGLSVIPPMLPPRTLTLLANDSARSELARTDATQVMAASTWRIPALLQILINPGPKPETLNSPRFSNTVALAAAQRVDGGVYIRAPLVALVDSAGTAVTDSLTARSVQVYVVDDPPLTSAQMRDLGGLGGVRVSGTLGGTLEQPLVGGLANFTDLFIRSSALRRVIQLEFRVQGTRFSARSAPFAVTFFGFHDRTQFSVPTVTPGVPNQVYIVLSILIAAGLSIGVAELLFRHTEARLAPMNRIPQSKRFRLDDDDTEEDRPVSALERDLDGALRAVTPGTRERPVSRVSTNRRGIQSQLELSK